MRNIWLPMASACLVLGSCAEDYKETIPVPEKPVEVAMAERLASYDMLSEYSSQGGIKVGVRVDPDVLAKKDMLSSVVLTNFDHVVSSVSLTPKTFLNTESEYDFTTFSTLTDAAALLGVEVFGPALCSDINIPDDYLKSLIADVVIPYEPWSEDILEADFEDQAVGTAYPSAKKGVGSVAVAIAEDPKGVQGKVLGCTELTMDIPLVTGIKLPAGFTLKDVSRVKVRCLVTGGTPTTSRIQVESAGYSEKGNPYSSKEWEDYVFDLSNLKLKDAELDLNTISIGAGAYGSKVTCYIDEITIQLEHRKGDDTVITKTPEEKAEIISGELYRWVDGVVDASGSVVKNFIIFDEPLDSEISRFHWSDYLGDKYIPEVEKAVVAKVPDARFFVSQSVTLNDMLPEDVNMIAARISELEGNGVRVDGVNLVLDATYNLDYSTQVAADAAARKAIASLASFGKPVRISSLKLSVVDTNGAQVNPQNMSVATRQAVAEYYQLIISALRSELGDKAEAISFSTAFDTTIEPGLWLQNGDRSFIYEGVAKGLSM